MDAPPQSIRDLARELVAAHAETEHRGPRGVVVHEKLRPALTRFAGAHGFEALLRRALALARAEVPALAHAKVSAEGRLEGFDQIARLGAEVEREAATAVTAHVLWLLVTFIGESLTYKLVRDVFPDAPPGAPPDQGDPP